MLLALAAACALLALPRAASAATTFDHFTTGFELVGQHRTTACESCHVGGIFKGTPHDCSACHVPGARIGATAKPVNHIVSSNNCAECHTPFAWKPVANFNHLNVLGTCSSCHNSVQSIGKPSNHIPTTAECSSCHLPMLPWQAAHFSHPGITGNCASCHDNVHAPGRPTGHLPTSQPCETCHSPTNFTTFAGTQMNHAGITNDCQACHETGMNWYGVTMVDRPTPAQDSAHPTATAPNGADCSNCHHGFNVGDFTLNSKPANHIPTAMTATCGNCHTSTDFSVIPTVTNIHQYAPSTSANCAQCHGSAATSFAIPSANFSIVGQPANHVPTTASCETCHVGAGSSIAATPVMDGASFKNSAMSHAGITARCANCHAPTVTGSTFIGITAIVVMPPTSPVGVASHVPSNTTCETCHLGSTPAGLVPANSTVMAPGTKFATPIPTTAMIHTGISSKCANCHESNYVWMGMSSYPISPTTLTGNLSTQYTGFNTRPGATAGTFTIADAAHPTGGDCSQCHTSTAYFDGNLKPSNHIPTSPTSTCTNCHTTSNFATMPTLADIHLYAPSTTTNCAQCHGSAAASFAIPAANFSIVGLPTNHIPTTASCENCHVGAGSSVAATPVPNGAKFTNSAMSHAGITTGCATCHGPTITGASFVGITKIVVMPSTSPAGANAHVPSGTTCETCHLGSTPAGFVPANATLTAPGTKFQTPIPTTAMIHTGVTSNCSSCHESPNVWMGMTNYPISPAVLSGNSSTQYTGFNTRPGAAAGTYIVADAAHPTSGDCSQCHSSTTYFEGQPKPANHIPTSTTATCQNCHTSSDFSVMPTLANIHQYAPSTSTNCAQCHGSAAASFAIPAVNFSIVGLPAGHVPTTASCENCHVGAGSSIAATPVPNGAKFTNSAMSHSGITTGCVTCHGPTVTGATFTGITKIVVMPPTSPAGASSHVPSGTTCETCHVGSTPAGLVPANATLTAPGTKFATPIPTTAQIHSGVTSNCSSCHESPYVWMGMTNYPISPTTMSSSSSTQYLGFNTRPGAAAGTYIIADAAHPATGDCSQCHTGTTYFAGNVKPSNHIPTSTTATCQNCHTSSDFSVMPTLANIHLYAPSTTSNCSQCHGSAAASFAIPAANFSIVGLPTNHIPTTTSCESCHVGAGSSIAATPVPNGAKFTNSTMNHAGLSTGCASCHGPTVTGFAGITKIVVMPPTSPAGANSHVPSGTTCETCHLASMPSGRVAANATLSPPGTKFGTPAPSTSQIHTGISSGCSNCHEAGYVWMGMTYYPISPTTLSTNTSTQYIGFQTRPGLVASTYSVADPVHPTSGDCVGCHGGNFNYFSGQAEPSNHIPTLTQTCSTCHTTAGNYAVYTTNLTTLHSVVTTACSTCHADGKGPFAGAAGFVIVQMSTRGLHIPITKSGVAVECSGCHKTVTAFSGTIMSHAAIGDAGTSAAGNACDACHEYGMRNKWYGLSTWQRDSANHYYCAPGGTTICPNGGADCTTGCHQHSVSSRYAVQPRRGVKSQTGAAVGSALAAQPGGKFDHTTIAARCFSCHDGTRATGKPATHPFSGDNCDRCHTTSAWRPAAFDHVSVTGTGCVTCHRVPAAKLATHVVTSASCDSCHYTLAWTPTKPAKGTPTVRPPTPKLPPVVTPRRPNATGKPAALPALSPDPQAPAS